MVTGLAAEARTGHRQPPQRLCRGGPRCGPQTRRCVVTWVVGASSYGRIVRAIQGTLDDLGTPLHQVTFVVVDLETTGGSPSEHAITEIGAVKVRGGESLGEFQTLVNPQRPIPAFVQVLTGITEAMVAGAPPIRAVLPSFLEFAAGAVLVAHNAPFDMSFLKAAALRTGTPWPAPTVVDTVQLARQLVPRDEAPDRRLATLAALFGTTCKPDHRALHDARATVDVLHALIGRVGNVGVRTLEELTSFTSRVSQAQRRKRHLAAGLPRAAGVYLFRDAQQRVLYVGTSTDLRRRVAGYFTAAERRSRMAQMVALAESVTAVVCQTPLEAQVRELRLIAEHQPRFNRRSRRPSGRPWVKLTVEPFPRLSVVRQVRSDAAAYVGPFPDRQAAQRAVEAILEALPLRQCTLRLSERSRGGGCLLGEIGRCSAPCRGGAQQQEYASVASQAAQALTGDSRAVLTVLQQRMAQMAAAERFEQAAIVRDRMTQLVRGAALAQRLRPLAAIPELVAARRRPAGGWEVVCVRHGRLAGTTLTPPGADPIPFIEAVCRSAEVVPTAHPPNPAASWEETSLILSWLETDGVRLVHVEGEWSCPVNGAGAASRRLAASVWGGPTHPAGQPAVRSG